VRSVRSVCFLSDCRGRSFRERQALVWAKTDYHCWYCGVNLRELTGRWTSDHQVPVSRGGSDESSNLVPACDRCNVSKRDRTPDEHRRAMVDRWRRDLSRILGELRRVASWLPDAPVTPEKLQELADIDAYLQTASVTFAGERQ